MGYSAEDDMVRVDFFKQSGKWYTTEAVKWTGGYSSCCIYNAFAESLREHFHEDFNHNRLDDMDAVCLHPYHQHAHPLMLRQGEWLTLSNPQPQEELQETNTLVKAFNNKREKWYSATKRHNENI